VAAVPSATLAQATPVVSKAAQATPVVSKAAPSNAASPAEVGVFSADKAYNHVKVLASDIGIRAAGSPNQQKAGAYIAGQFEASGLKADFQESLYNWQRDKGSSLTIVGDSNSAALKLRLIYAGGNAPGQFEGEVVYLDSTNINDLAVLAGKVVVLDGANRSNANIQKLLGAAENSRPLAVLLVSDDPPPLLPPNLRKASVTVGYIEQAARQRLPAQNNGLKVKLNLNWEKSDITVRNVTGTRPATSNSDNKVAPIIIIGGHYDSVPEGPGANDNASGTAITLELARVLAKAYPEVELRFVAFDGEELGLLGSRDYVSKLTSAEKSRILAMFNLDMVTTGQTLEVAGVKSLSGIAKGVALDLGLRDVTVQAVERGGGGSDHASFAQANIPFLFFNRQSDPNYHRASDTPDKFDSKPLDEVAQIMLGTLQRFLSDPNQG